MRLIKLVVLALLAIILVTVALANREMMTIRLLPEELARLAGLNWDVSLPVFLVLLVAFLAGVLFGYFGEWLRESKHRSAARAERRERQRLEKHVEKTAPGGKTGDDVLAILDGR